MRLPRVSFERGKARGRKSLTRTKGCVEGVGLCEYHAVCAYAGTSWLWLPFLRQIFPPFFFSFVDLDRKGRAIFSFSPNIIQEGSRALGDMWLYSKGHLQKDSLGKESLP